MSKENSVFTQQSYVWLVTIQIQSFINETRRESTLYFSRQNYYSVSVCLFMGCLEPGRTAFQLKTFSDIYKEFLTICEV